MGRQADEIMESEGFLATPVSLIPPIHKVPQEILEKIFSWVASDRDVVVEYHAGMRAIGPLMHAIRVCTIWREIILSNPSFWRNVEIRGTELVSDQELAAILERIFRKSGDSTLNLTLSYHTLGSPDATRTMILPISNRIESLSVSQRPTKDMAGIYQPIQGQLSSLRSLYLNIHQQRWDRTALECFVSAPRLTDATLTITPGYIPLGSEIVPPVEIHLPWARLQSLCLQTSTTAQLYNILQHCHNLFSLEIIPLAPLTRWSDVPYPIQLNSLSSLSIGVKMQVHRDDWDVTARTYLLFQPFTAPALRSMSLSFINILMGDSIIRGNFSWTSMTQELEKMVIRSRSSLMTLNITFGGDRCVVDAEEIMSALRVLPSLTSLSIDDQTWFETSLNVPHVLVLGLHIPTETSRPESEAASSGILLPQLQKLTISAPVSEIQHIDFLTAVKSRSSRRIYSNDNIQSSSEAEAEGISRLEEVKFTFKCEQELQVGEDILESYRDLKKRGLRISIYYQKKPGWNPLVKVV